MFLTIQGGLFEPVESLPDSTDVKSSTAREIRTPSNNTLQHPFYDGQLHALLKSNNVLGNSNELIPDPLFKPCSKAQKTELVSIIDETFTLKDPEENEIVLSDLSPRKILDILYNCTSFNKAKASAKTIIFGGTVTKILQSDMNWVSECVCSTLPETEHNKAKALIAPFPDRNVPDLDIHVFCENLPKITSNSIIDQFVYELSKLALKSNRSYIEKQINKYANIKITPETENKIKTLHSQCVTYVEHKNNENCNPEALDVLLHTAAQEIVKVKGLGNLSNKAFGILSIGSIDIVLKADNDYLLTPDKLGILFDPTIQVQDMTEIKLFPENHKGKEALVHRAAKIAVIDKDPTVHTFFKTCVYKTLGYHVTPQAKIDEALNKFYKHIYHATTGCLTQEGIDFLKRYEANHFQSNPEEGLCTLIHAFRMLSKSGKSEIIPLIVSQLKEYFQPSFTDPFLETIRKLMVAHPKRFDLIDKSLCLFSKGSWNSELNFGIHSFSHKNSQAAHFLTLSHSPEKRVNLVKEYSSYEISTFVEPFLAAEIPLLADLYPYVKLLLSEENHRGWALRLLLKIEQESPPPELIDVIPEIFESLSPEQSIELTGKLKKAFKSLSFHTCLEHFENIQNLQGIKKITAAWISALSKQSDYVAHAYKLWTNLESGPEPSESKELGISVFNLNPVLGLKILRKGLSVFHPNQFLEIQEKIRTYLLNLMVSKSPFITTELSTIFNEFLAWQADCLIQNRDVPALKKLLETVCAYFGNYLCLEKSKSNFWSYLTHDECIELIHDLIGKVRSFKIDEGIHYLLTQKLSLTQNSKLLETFYKFKEYFEKNTEETFQSTLLSTYAILVKKIKNECSLDLSAITTELLNTSLRLHQNSKKTIFIKPLALAIELFLTQEASAYDKDKAIATLSQLLCISHSILEPLKADIGKVIVLLIPYLKQNELSLANFFKLLKESNLNFDNIKEISEVYYHLELAKSENKTGVEGKIQNLFAKGQDVKDEKAYIHEINEFFQMLLTEKHYAKVGLFLSGLRKIRLTFNYTQIDATLSKKLKSLVLELNKARTPRLKDIVDLLEQVLELKTPEELGKLFTEIRFRQNEVKDYWEFLFRAIKFAPPLRPLLLNSIIQNIPRKKLQNFLPYFSENIRENSFPHLNKEEIRDCLTSYLQILGQYQSPQLIEHLNHKQTIEFHLAPNELEIVVQWIINCSELVEGTYFEDADVQTFLKYRTELKERCKSTHPQLYKKVFWCKLSFSAKSYDAPTQFSTWTSIYKKIGKKNHVVCYEACAQQYNNVILTLFDNSTDRDALYYDSNVLPALLNTSNYFLKAYDKVNANDPASKSLKQISPIQWIHYLSKINSKLVHRTLLKWMRIYSNLKDKLTDREHILFCDIINKAKGKVDSTKNITLSLIIDCFHNMGNENKTTSSLWKRTLNEVLFKYCIFPTAENCDLLIQTTDCALSFGYDKNYTLFPPDHLRFLFKLIEMGEYSRFIRIWNNVAVRGTSDLNSDMKIIHQNNKDCLKDPSGFQIIFPVGITRLSPRGQTHFVDCMIETFECINNTLKTHDHSQHVKLFLYDLAHGCMLGLLNSASSNSKIIEYNFLIHYYTLYCDLIPMSEEAIYRIHVDIGVKSITECMFEIMTGVHTEEVFYDSFIRLGYDAIFTEYIQRSSTKTIDKKEFAKALNRVMAQKPVDRASIQVNAYPYMMLAKAFEKGYIEKYQQYVYYLFQVTRGFLDLEETLSPDSLTYLKTCSLFKLSPENLISIVLLVNSAENPQKAEKEIYQALFDTYLNFLESKNLKTWRDTDFRIPFQTKFGDFTLEYELEMQNLVDCFDRVLQKDLSALDYGQISQKILPFIFKFPTKLSLQGQERRKAFVEKWIKQCDAKGTEIYKKLSSLLSVLLKTI